MKLVICIECLKPRPMSPCGECGPRLRALRERKRGSSTQRGYGYAHRKASASVGLGTTHCPRCGCAYSRENPMTKDHVIPKSKGGTNSEDNYEPMCRSCNSKKGNNLE